jgi:hypothetical protein
VQLRGLARRIYPVRFAYAKLWAIKHYWPAMRSKPRAALRFLIADPELDNYSYEISNARELTTFLAELLHCDPTVIEGYIDELDGDDRFRLQLNRRLRTRADRKATAHYGRRVGWYCVCRFLKPSCVVEAGVHDGLGSAVFLLALEHNRREGYSGRLIGIDIDPRSGWLIPADFRDSINLIISDSVSALNGLAANNELVELFVHDSLHSYEHETREYTALSRTLSSRGVIISDNAHSTDALRDFSVKHNRRYAFWRERPKDHFYPGAGIGISLPR